MKRGTRFGRFGIRGNAAYREANAYRAPKGTFGNITLADRETVFDSGVRDRSYQLALGYELTPASELLHELSAVEADTLLIWLAGDRPRGIRSQDVNDYIRGSLGDGFSAKDFRTWNATVLAAALLSQHDVREGRKAVTSVVREVATHLGNTPAVCRASYVDPRITDRFLDQGEVIRPEGRGRRSVEEAVLRLPTKDFGPMLIRFTASRHGERIFVVAGSAPEKKYDKYKKVFAIAAIGFSPGLKSQ